MERKLRGVNCGTKIVHKTDNFLTFSAVPTSECCLLNSWYLFFFFWANRLSVKCFALFCRHVNNGSELGKLSNEDCVNENQHSCEGSTISAICPYPVFLSLLPGNGGCFRKFVSTSGFYPLCFGAVSMSDYTTTWVEWLP